MGIINHVLLLLIVSSGAIFGYILAKIAKSEMNELKKYLFYTNNLVISIIIFYAASLLDGWQESIAMLLSLIVITLIIVYQHAYVKYIMALFFGVLLIISYDVLLIGVLLFIHFMIVQSIAQKERKTSLIELSVFFISYVSSFFLLGV